MATIRPRPIPSKVISWSVAPLTPSISVEADSPFIARRLPPVLTICQLIFFSFSSGATARAVTKSADFFTSWALPRMTSILSPATASLRKETRRSRGSIRVTERSGRARAITIPGRPAPEPISKREAPCGSNWVTGRQLKIWRSHIRSPSRGPIRPRSIPAVWRKWA